jgi:hypothetical protein
LFLKGASFTGVGSFQSNPISSHKDSAFSSVSTSPIPSSPY